MMMMMIIGFLEDGRLNKSNKISTLAMRNEFPIEKIGRNKLDVDCEGRSICFTQDHHKLGIVLLIRLCRRWRMAPEGNRRVCLQILS